MFREIDGKILGKILHFFGGIPVGVIRGSSG